MNAQTRISRRCYWSADLAIVVSRASWTVVLEARPPVDRRSYGKRTDRVSHSSLDGAQNAPPTTAHRHSSYWP